MSRENVEIVRSAWEAWSQGDIDALFDFYDPANEWDMTHSLVPDMGVYHGHEGVRDFFREWWAFFAEYDAEPEEFIDADESVVVRARHGGRGRRPRSAALRSLPTTPRCRASGRSTGCVAVEPCVSRST
jgi:ketosteroid isomerase-like protein